MTHSNLYGEFAISAHIGDTLEFTGSSYNAKSIVVSDFKDTVIYMEAFIALSEVVIRSNTVKQDLLDVQHGYRKKGVF